MKRFIPTILFVSAFTSCVVAQSQSSLSVSASETTTSATTDSPQPSSTTVSSNDGMISTHVISVGGPNGSLAFYPNSIKASPGDLVQFQFHPKNHSVVQSTFDNPCIPIQNIQANKTDAFFSGFMPTNASFGTTSSVLTYTIRIKDEKPVWFYCSQGKHCQEGMVGAINAPTTGNRTMKAFVALAAKATQNLSPGQGSGSSATPSNPSGSGNSTLTSPSGTATDGAAASSRAPPSASANAAAEVGSQSIFGLGAAAAAALALL